MKEHTADRSLCLSSRGRHYRRGFLDSSTRRLLLTYFPSFSLSNLRRLPEDSLRDADDCLKISTGTLHGSLAYPHFPSVPVSRSVSHMRGHVPSRLSLRLSLPPSHSGVAWCLE